jgi:hypothetical protein
MVRSAWLVSIEGFRKAGVHESITRLGDSPPALNLLHALDGAGF